jgi:hypothetical protein
MLQDQGQGTRMAYSRKEQSDLEWINKAMGSMETWYWYGTLTCESMTALTRKKARRTSSVGFSAELAQLANSVPLLAQYNPRQSKKTMAHHGLCKSACGSGEQARPQRGLPQCRVGPASLPVDGQGPLLWFPRSRSLYTVRMALAHPEQSTYKLLMLL